MKSEIFNFHIPENLIAQKPAEERSNSRLLVYERKKDLLTDSAFKDLTDFLSSDDFLVFNNSKVIPSRFSITKKENKRSGEILILKIIDEHSLEIITDKSRKYPVGTVIIFQDGNEAVIEKEIDDQVKVLRSDNPLFSLEYIEKYGNIPLPPYINKGKADINDRVRYQTTYAKDYGSAAAPTAGLHFDNFTFNLLNEKKIDYSFVSLNVGLGTFQPIYTEEIEDHKIHTEEYLIDKIDADKINTAVKNNKRVIPVGTTSLRTIESAFDPENNKVISGKNSTDIYIYPGYEFKITGGLVTNFHTPKSSLAVLVSALVGVEKLLEIYDHAVKKEYRFFSYGDAMLIL
jgi:S-adenosylmethionine:tRNA ribosyltransferase-isomerase